MAMLTSVKHAESELKKAGIDIWYSRTMSCNSFYLIYPESWLDERKISFFVNTPNANYETVKAFGEKWTNICIRMNT